MSYQRIESYGIIGDLHTAALVGMDGSIDFMCLPHFDGPTIFAALLDHEKGGRFGHSSNAGIDQPNRGVNEFEFIAEVSWFF